MFGLPARSTLFPYTTLFRSRLLRVSGIVMRLRMFLLLITFLKASHSFRNRLLEGDKQDRKSGSAGMPRPISYAVLCLKKKNGNNYITSNRQKNRSTNMIHIQHA